MSDWLKDKHQRQCAKLEAIQRAMWRLRKRAAVLYDNGILTTQARTALDKGVRLLDQFDHLLGPAIDVEWEVTLDALCDLQAHIETYIDAIRADHEDED